MKRRRNAPLWARLLWRRLRSPEGRLAPLAVLSIAISVTLATGLEMSSRSAQRQLEETAGALTGAAQIEVVAGGVGVPESLLEVVKSTKGVVGASPMLTMAVRVADRKLALNIVGVDLLAEEQVQRTAIERQGLQVRDTLRLLATPNSVVVTNKLLELLGRADAWSRGERVEIPVSTNSGETTLVVQGVLEERGVARAFGGQVAVMDVYAAQEISRRSGLFDRIDVVVEGDGAVSEVIDRLNSRLSAGAVAQPSEWLTSIGRELFEVVQRATVLFAAAAALVAALLSYSTTSQWVERQNRQIATIRAAGMEAVRVRRGLLVEIGVLAILGTALGIVGGILVSPPILVSLSAFLAASRIGELDRVEISDVTIGVALVVGLVGALAGAIVPARRSTHRFAFDGLQLAEGGIGWRSTQLAIGAVALLAFGVAVLFGGQLFEGLAMVRLGMMFVAAAVAVIALSPALAQGMQVLTRALVGRSPLIRHLAVRGLRRRPVTFGVAVAAIAILVASLTASFLLIETLAATNERWTMARYGDGVIVSAAPFLTTRPPEMELLKPETIDELRRVPGVSAVAESYRNRATVLFRGHTVWLNAASVEVLAQRASLVMVGRSSASVARDLAGGDLAVSMAFARRFGVAVGDQIELPTQIGGNRTFDVAGIFEDFGPPGGGAILLDVRTYDSGWKRDGASSASVWIEGPRDSALAGMRERASQDLFFAAAADVAASNRSEMENFRGVLQVLGAFLALLGAAGVMVLLVGVVVDRRRDFSVLRASGAESSQLIQVVLFDAALVGLSGASIGLGIGVLCADPAANVLREGWGWALESVWFAREVPAIFIGAVVAAVLGAAVPARIASRILATDVFGPE